MKSTKQKRYDVFISYSSRDQKVVEGLCAYLEQHKIRCFVAYRDVPFDAPWAESIVDALESSRMMLVVFSNNYNKSRQVDREIEIASEENLPILTFRLSDDQYVGAKRFYLKNLNWIDAFPHPEATFGRVTENVAKLLGLSLNREEGASGGSGSGSGSGSGGSVVERPRKRNGLILPIASLLVVIAVVCIALLINKSDGGGELVPTDETSIAVETSSEETLIAVDALQPPQPKAPQATAAQPQKNVAQTTITTPQVQQKGAPTPTPQPRQEKVTPTTTPQPRQESTSKSVPAPKAQEPQKPAKAPASQQVKQTTSKKVEPKSATATKTYKVGDYYDDGTKQGVVFEVSDDGRYGKIVSLTQSILQWADDAVWENKIGAGSSTDGAENMKKVQTISGWRELYPAFRWCAELGEGWYLPANEELKTLLLNDSVHNAVNATLKARGATCLFGRGDMAWYWSSTEYPDDEFCAWFASMYDGYIIIGNKSSDVYVRAVATICFDAEKKSVTATATKTYKVGDYYDDGTKQGVVFEVTDGGRHGKIVSLTQSSKQLQWAVGAVWKNKIGADSSTDGAANMKKVQTISGWRELYPAFRWCADLGEGWYLPAIEELKTLLLNDSVHNAVNATLKARGATRLYDVGEKYCWYWSSTEDPYDEFCAWYVIMGNGYTGNVSKYYYN